MTKHIVKLVWSEQTIDTTTYQSGESTGVEFEIIVSNDYPIIYVKKGSVAQLTTKVK